MRKVIFFCRRWKWNSQATGEGGWGGEHKDSVQLSSTNTPEEGFCSAKPNTGELGPGDAQGTDRALEGLQSGGTGRGAGIGGGSGVLAFCFKR